MRAAIAALHDEATDVADTDRPQILALYDVLLSLLPSPVVALRRRHRCANGRCAVSVAVHRFW